MKKSNNIRLADLRRARCYTQGYLASLLGVAQSTVAMWETGKAVPTMRRIIALADLYGMKVDEICAFFKDQKRVSGKRGHSQKQAEGNMK